jgi:hypothetical protein
MAMLLCHIPEAIRTQSTSLNDFSPLAEAMSDYALFLPRVWQHVCIKGTLAEFLSTALYQIVRRVQTDAGVDKGHYPTFELAWRGSLATRLANVLPTPPTALCPSIHRVIPIGVSSMDAMKAMEVAIPKDIQDPYTITVKSSAVDDQCGSIAITQPTHHTIVNINCTLDPGILIDVCRELRLGHRAVIHEVNSMKRKHDETNTQLVETNKQLANMRVENEQQLTNTRVENNQKLNTIQKEMATIVKKLMIGGHIDQVIDIEEGDDEPVICSRKRCENIITKRFKSGKRQKQCVTCQSHGQNKL